MSAMYPMYLIMNCPTNLKVTYTVLVELREQAPLVLLGHLLTPLRSVDYAQLNA